MQGQLVRNNGKIGFNVKKFLILIIIFILPAPLLAKREHPEKWYQEKWCEAHKGQVEVVLPDGSLVKSLIS